MGDLALPIRSPRQRAIGGRLSSDERLARLVSGGSTWAFGLLYQRHHQALYRYCRSIVRDEEDAQDALQSAMLHALAALRAEERDLAVRPWLFRIVHNEAVSLVRRRRPEVMLTEELEPLDPGLERTLEGRERLATLVRDLRALAERQRSALVMRELSGLSIEEIAAVLSTSPGAAKQAVFEARCALLDFTEGRAMQCEQVRRAISDGDRRTLRGRKLRGHLRECRGCREFETMIGERSGALHALAPPMPTTAATAMLGRLLAHGGAQSAHTGGLAVASGAAVGKPAVMSLAAKVLAVGAVTVAAAGGARLAFSPRQHAHLPHPATKPADLIPSTAGPGGQANDGRASSKASRSGGALPASGPAIARGRAYGTTLASGRTIPPGVFAESGSPLVGLSLGPAFKGHGASGAARKGSGINSHAGRPTAGHRGTPLRGGGSLNHHGSPTPRGRGQQPVRAQGPGQSGAPGPTPPGGASTAPGGQGATAPLASPQASASKEAHAP